MTFGEQVELASTAAILDRAVERGVTFIDGRDVRRARHAKCGTA